MKKQYSSFGKQDGSTKKQSQDSSYLQLMALNSYSINGITAPVTKVNKMLYISL